MILVVNTAEEVLQVLLAQGDKLLEHFQEHCCGRMNEVMAPAAQQMLDRRGVSSLTALACVRGPGSFTGVRLGLAFCHGVSLARALPMAGLDYLPLLAAAGFTSGQTFDEVHVLAHSRTARVYHQAFASGPDLFTPSALSPPRDLVAQAAHDAIAARVAAAPSLRFALLGTGLRRNAAVFAPLAGSGDVALLDIEAPTHQALLRAAQAAAYDGPPIEACYLRGSDAEENLAVIAAARGLSEAEALVRMEDAMK